jgi:hypothetical protein
MKTETKNVKPTTVENPTAASVQSAAPLLTVKTANAAADSITPQGFLILAGQEYQIGQAGMLALARLGARRAISQETAAIADNPVEVNSKLLEILAAWETGYATTTQRKRAEKPANSSGGKTAKGPAFSRLVLQSAMRSELPAGKQDAMKAIEALTDEKFALWCEQAAKPGHKAHAVYSGAIAHLEKAAAEKAEAERLAALAELPDVDFDFGDDSGESDET